MAKPQGESRNAEAMTERRQLILATADELLAENGLDGLTIRAVLARTMLARRAFYDVFSSKDDLVLAMFEHTLADAAVTLADAGEGLASPQERLELVVHSIVSTGPVGEARELVRRDKRAAAFSREHLRLAQVRPEQLQRAIEPLVALIRSIIVEGIERGGWQSQSPDRAARFVYNLVSTTVHTETLDPGFHTMASDEREALAAQLSTFCLNALAAVREI
jgi:AcrR family transcriptional regulator